MIMSFLSYYMELRHDIEDVLKEVNALTFVHSEGIGKLQSCQPRYDSTIWHGKLGVTHAVIENNKIELLNEKIELLNKNARDKNEIIKYYCWNLLD